MLTIWKYPVAIDNDFSLELPADAKILTMQLQYGDPMLWVLLNPEAQSITRTFCLAGTGHSIAHDAESLLYIATIQLQAGTLIFHLFEIV